MNSDGEVSGERGGWIGRRTGSGTTASNSAQRQASASFLAVQLARCLACLYERIGGSTYAAREMWPGCNARCGCDGGVRRSRWSQCKVHISVVAGPCEMGRVFQMYVTSVILDWEQDVKHVL